MTMSSYIIRVNMMSFYEGCGICSHWLSIQFTDQDIRVPT